MLSPREMASFRALSNKCRHKSRMTVRDLYKSFRKLNDSSKYDAYIDCIYDHGGRLFKLDRKLSIEDIAAPRLLTSKGEADSGGQLFCDLHGHSRKSTPYKVAQCTYGYLMAFIDAL